MRASSSGVENFAMILGGRWPVAEVDNVNTEIRIYIIVFTAIEIIIHQTSAMTSSINPSELRLLILLYIYFRCYLFHCCFYCEDLSDKLRVLFSNCSRIQSANIVMNESALGTGAFITFSDKPWILDSGASTYMIGIKEKFHSFFFLKIFLLLILLMVFLSLFVKKGLHTLPPLCH